MGMASLCWRCYPVDASARPAHGAMFNYRVVGKVNFIGFVIKCLEYNQ